MIKGYPICKAFADYGTITVDGVQSPEEKWTTPNINQLPMGQVTKNKTKLDFLYDYKYLYFTANVVETSLINTMVDNDAVRLYIDVDDVSGTSPQKGMHHFTFDTNGTVKYRRGEGGYWHVDTNTSGILYALNIHSNHYIFEAAIPWSFFGKTRPPVDDRMAIAIEVFNRVAQYQWSTDVIPDVSNNASWTWLEFRLTPSDDMNIYLPKSADSEIKAYIINNQLFINSPYLIKELSVFSLDGKLINKINDVGYSYQMSFSVQGGAILNLLLEDGRVVNQKILN